MEQHFEALPNLSLEAFEDMSYSDLPVISPNAINGILADLENLSPITPFSEVNAISKSIDYGTCIMRITTLGRCGRNILLAVNNLDYCNQTLFR